MSRFSFRGPARAALALVGVLTLAGAGQGEEGPVVSARPGQRVARPLPAPVDGAIRLSLDEAIAIVIANNQDLNIAVYNAEATQYFLMASEGIFDPLVGAFANRNHDETPSSSALSGAPVSVKLDSYNFGANVTQLAPWGGTFQLGTAGGRTATNSTFANPNPGFTAGLTATVSQPLLRNFGFTATKWQIYISKNTRDASYQRFVRVVQNGVNSVEQAYWDLAYAYQNLEVAKETLRIAQDLNRITKIRIDVGSLAPIDITQTEVGIAQAEQQIITAEGQIGNFQDTLKRLMSFDPAQYTIPIIPTDSVRVESVTVNVDQGVTAALARRPEILAQEYTVDSGRVEYEYWSNQALPQVNLVASYGTAGQGGSFFFDPCVIPGDPRCPDPTNPPPPVLIADNGLGNAYHQTINRLFPSWSIGLNISYPILNRYAKGQRGAARYLWESSRATLTTTQQNVVVEVRDAARQIDTAQRQIAATAKGRELAERNLDAEKKKFDNGMTTSFQVNQIQRDLSAARVTELQALVFFRKAVAAYHNAVADNLEWKGISIEGIPETTAPPSYANTTAAASLSR
ncbi:MAG TPA: TolC family protein [Thermoanaerobaculia bacterium]